MLMSFFKKALLVCLSLSFIQTISAQDNYEPFKSRFALKAYPLQMMIGHNPLSSEWGLHGELSIAKRTSVELAWAYCSNSILFQPNAIIPDSLTDIKVITSGQCFRAGVRFYLGKQQPSMKGFYLAPMIGLSTTNIYDKPDKNLYIKMIYASMGLNFGYQILLPSGICFDFNLGLAGRYGVGIVKVRDESVTISGIAPKISMGLGVGYCFN